MEALGDSPPQGGSLSPNETDLWISFAHMDVTGMAVLLVGSRDIDLIAITGDLVRWTCSTCAATLASQNSMPITWCPRRVQAQDPAAGIRRRLNLLRPRQHRLRVRWFPL